MSTDEKEKLQCNLEGEISVLTEMNKKLGEEVEKLKKSLESKDLALQKVLRLLANKSIGVSPAVKIYIDTIRDEVEKFLRDKGDANE